MRNDINTINEQRSIIFHNLIDDESKRDYKSLYQLILAFFVEDCDMLQVKYHFPKRQNRLKNYLQSLHQTI